jgi:uncharacterized protein (DUF427 family)
MLRPTVADRRAVGGLTCFSPAGSSGPGGLDAAWYYPHPSPLARKIKNHVAFWNGVRIEGQPEPAGPRG